MGVFLPDDPDGNAKLVFSILDCLPKANRVSILLALAQNPTFDAVLHVYKLQNAGTENRWWNKSLLFLCSITTREATSAKDA